MIKLFHVPSFSHSFSFFSSGFSSVAWDFGRRGQCMFSPHCFLFACGGPSSGSTGSSSSTGNAHSGVVHSTNSVSISTSSAARGSSSDTSDTHNSSSSCAAAGGHGVSSIIHDHDGSITTETTETELTKLEPLPNMEPAMGCYSDRGAMFGNMNSLCDVGHYSNYVRVNNNRRHTCFNISSIVPYGDYTLEEMEVFTIKYE